MGGTECKTQSRSQGVLGVSCYCMILLKGKWEGSVREQREPLWGRSIQKPLHHCVKKKTADEEGSNEYPQQKST